MLADIALAFMDVYRSTYSDYTWRVRLCIDLVGLTNTNIFIQNLNAVLIRLSKRTALNYPKAFNRATWQAELDGYQERLEATIRAVQLNCDAIDLIALNKAGLNYVFEEALGDCLHIVLMHCLGDQLINGQTKVSLEQAKPLFGKVVATLVDGIEAALVDNETLIKSDPGHQSLLEVDNNGCKKTH